ncbi:MAG TPA: YciI family protein [Solirubrobacteraceae bacterium]|nr:YciI family protein [Solirubrobacteraceae bacterium]
MAQYMLLIYGDPANAPGPDEQEAQYAEWLNYTNSLVASGVMVSGAPLEGAEQATTVRSRGGQVETAEGPAVETQEILGGYYLVDVPDRAAAEALAAQMPNIDSGSVEVRPVVVFPDAA